MKKLLTTLSILLIATVSYAETITLTSGKVIEGEIIERTDELIKVDLGIGVNTTYYMDEVENIEVQSTDKTEKQKQAEYVVMKYVPEFSTSVFYLGDQEVARLSGMEALGEIKKEVINGTIPNGPVRTRLGSEDDYHFREYQFVDNEPVKDSIRIYDSQGSLAEGLYLEDGKINGVFKGYDKRTKATTEQYFKDGKDVEFKLYREDGTLVSNMISDYEKNEFITMWYHKNGNLKTETKSKLDDVSKFLYKKEYDESGNLISEE